MNIHYIKKCEMAYEIQNNWNPNKYDDFYNKRSNSIWKLFNYSDIAEKDNIIFYQIKGNCKI